MSPLTHHPAEPVQAPPPQNETPRQGAGKPATPPPAEPHTAPSPSVLDDMATCG